MRKYLIAVFACSVMGCGVKIQSVVDRSLTAPYSNPLVLILYDVEEARNFSSLLKDKIGEVFKANNQIVQVSLVEQNSSQLKLNSVDEVDRKVSAAVALDNKDLVLILRPTRISMGDFGPVSSTYVISGTDLKSKREVWKAEFTTTSSFGPSLFAEKTALSIYKKLKSDRIL